MKDKPRGKADRAQIHSEVKDKIIEIKKDYPIFGVKRLKPFSRNEAILKLLKRN